MPSQSPGPFELASSYLRLRPDASVERLAVNAQFWSDMSSGRLGTFHNEYLVTLNTYDSAWPMWEMHPHGDEVVYLLSGAVDFRLEAGVTTQIVELRTAGQYVIVPRGQWHTATPRTPCCMLFITAGEGTQHRPAG